MKFFMGLIGIAFSVNTFAQVPYISFISKHDKPKTRSSLLNNDEPEPPVVDVTIGLKSINYSYREGRPSNETVVTVEITAGGEDLPSELQGIAFNLKTTPITADDQHNPFRGLYHDFVAPHPENGELYAVIPVGIGQTHIDIPIEIFDDEITENIERFRVDLSHAISFIPSDAVHEDSILTLAPNQGQVTIWDDDMSETYMRDRDQYVVESVGTIPMVQILERPVEYDFVIIHLTIGGYVPQHWEFGANSTKDYLGYSTTHEFEIYDSIGITYLTIVDDDLPERYKPLDGTRRDESMKVELLRNGLDLDDVTITNPSAFVHIRDDDPAFYIDEAAIIETETHWSIPIKVAYPLPRTVTVDYRFEHSEGDATYVEGTASFAPETDTAWAVFEKDSHTRDVIKLFNASHGKILDPDRLTGNQDQDADLLDEAEYMAYLPGNLSSCFPSYRQSYLDNCPNPESGYDYIETYGIDRIHNPQNITTRWTETYQVEVVDNNIYYGRDRPTSVEVRWCIEDKNGAHTRTTHCTAAGRLDTNCMTVPILIDSVQIRNEDHCSISKITAQPWVRMGDGNPTWMRGSGTCYPNPCPGENRRDRLNPPLVTENQTVVPEPVVPEPVAPEPVVPEPVAPEPVVPPTPPTGTWLHHMLSSGESPVGEGFYGFNTGSGDRAVDYETIRTMTKSIIVSLTYSDSTPLSCSFAEGSTVVFSWESGHVLTFVLRKDAKVKNGDRCRMKVHTDRINGVEPVGQNIWGNATF